jgi:hypothetical protein
VARPWPQRIGAAHRAKTPPGCRHFFDLGARHAALRDKLPNLTVLGGCCGTDHRHVREIVSRFGPAR